MGLLRQGLLALGLVAAVVTGAYAHGYYNSSEPGCDGSDPNVLVCDDFETGGWYGKDCDQARASGGILSQTKGWCGTIYANPTTPAGAVDCNNAGANGSRCAATSGQLTGRTGGRNMADHSFPGNEEVQDIYVRYYRKNSAGFIYSGQKVMTFNRCCAGSGGIFWAGLGFNIGQGSVSAGAPNIGITNNLGGDSIFSQNRGGGSMKSGNWYYFEVHLKLNTPGSSNGVFELWFNDCGPAGTSCGSAPILRARYANINWGKTASNGGIGSIWLENWANNGEGRGSQGQEWYDDVKIAKVGPIGLRTSTGGTGGAPVTGPAPSPPTHVIIH
jgi:hypothetical protein